MNNTKTSFSKNNLSSKWITNYPDLIFFMNNDQLFSYSVIQLISYYAHLEH